MATISRAHQRVRAAVRELETQGQEVAPYKVYVSEDLFLDLVVAWRSPGRPHIEGLEVHIDRRLDDDQIELRHAVRA